MKKLPRSLRKYIRTQKGLIRRTTQDLASQQGLIAELYKKIIGLNKRVA